MASTYRYLQREHDYTFTILTAAGDSFESDALDVRTLPDRAWRSVLPRYPLHLRRRAYRRHVDPHFAEADLVLTVDPTAYPQGALAIDRANRVGTPVWVDASVTVNGDFEPLCLLKRRREQSLLRATDRVLVTAPKVIERFRDRHLYDETVASAFSVIGHPVDTDRFHPPRDQSAASEEDDSVTILAVARLVPEKGLMYILEALAPLLAERPALEFRILGSGPMREHLARRAAELGVESAVTFLGTVPYGEVPAVLRTADVFVSHAVANAHWEEFFGVANLEAMACGLPTVVSDCGAIPHVLHREGVAEIVPQRHVSELREVICNLVDDPDRRVRVIGPSNQIACSMNCPSSTQAITPRSSPNMAPSITTPFLQV
jgi:glycosyltransferase involved in cell wall biosynthesis